MVSGSVKRRNGRIGLCWSRSWAYTVLGCCSHLQHSGSKMLGNEKRRNPMHNNTMNQQNSTTRVVRVEDCGGQANESWKDGLGLADRHLSACTRMHYYRSGLDSTSANFHYYDNSRLSSVYVVERLLSTCQQAPRTRKEIREPLPSHSSCSTNPHPLQ